MCLHRIHDPRVCINPACGITFTPIGRDRNYCTDQCRINYHNDRKRLLLNEQAHWHDPVLACEATLEELVQSELYQNEQISQKDLIRFGIDPSLVEPRWHPKTEGFIYWFGAYGIELLKPDHKKRYTIHYRTNLLKP